MVDLYWLIAAFVNVLTYELQGFCSRHFFTKIPSAFPGVTLPGNTVIVFIRSPVAALFPCWHFSGNTVVISAYFRLFSMHINNYF